MITFRAVDGNENGNTISGKSCSHTQKDAHSWWVVDLQKTFEVFTVVLKNREDCCGQYLEMTNNL